MRREIAKADYTAPKFISRQKGQRAKELCPIEVVERDATAWRELSDLAEHAVINARQNGHTQQKNIVDVILVIYDASLQHQLYKYYCPCSNHALLHVHPTTHSTA